MITAKVQYALILLKEIKEQPDGRPVKVKDVAKKHAIDKSFLESVARSLRINQVIRSVRGPGGGYLATQELSEISLLEVMAAVKAAKTLKMAVKSESGLAFLSSIENKLINALEDIKSLQDA
jgi:Rrf2 family protein